MPVIGWYHEMQKLSRQDALTFYKHYYAPNNAILIVSGDVTADEVKKLAEATYGKIPANPDISPVRHRPTDPPAIAARRLELKDPRAGNFSLQRYYIVPSYVTAKPGEAEALDLLMKIAGSGSTSRLYKKLVVDFETRVERRRRLFRIRSRRRRHLALRGGRRRRASPQGRGGDR